MAQNLEIMDESQPIINPSKSVASRASNATPEAKQIDPKSPFPSALAEFRSIADAPVDEIAKEAITKDEQAKIAQVKAEIARFQAGLPENDPRMESALRNAPAVTANALEDLVGVSKNIAMNMAGAEASTSPSGFTPEHPYGEFSAEGKLPKVEINAKEQMVGMAIATEPLINHERVKTPEDLFAEVERNIRTRENTLTIEENFIEDLQRELSRYSGDPAFDEVRADAFDNAYIRMHMLNQDLALKSANFENFANNIVYGDLFNYIWERYQGGKIKELGEIAEEDEGLFFREKHDPAAKVIGEKHRKLEEKLRSWYPGNSLEEQKERAKLQEIMMRLYNTTLMSIYYTGPVDSDGRLIDEKIMDATDRQLYESVGGSGRDFALNFIGKQDRFAKNINFFKLRHDTRMAAGNKHPAVMGWDKKLEKEGKKQPIFAADDPTAKGRRALYPAEDLASKNIGKATSLQGAIEGYALTLPHTFGFRSLSEMINSGYITKPADVGNWAGLVKNAGDIFKEASSKFLHEPLLGFESPNLGQVNQHVKNLNELASKYFVGIISFDAKLATYAGKQLLVDTLSYYESRYPDRKQEFWESPRPNDAMKMAIINQFRVNLKEDDKQEVLKAVGSSEGRVIANDLFKSGAGFLLERLTALLKLLFGMR